MGALLGQRQQLLETRCHAPARKLDREEIDRTELILDRLGRTYRLMNGDRTEIRVTNRVPTRPDSTPHAGVKP